MERSVGIEPRRADITHGSVDRNKLHPSTADWKARDGETTVEIDQLFFRGAKFLATACEKTKKETASDRSRSALRGNAWWPFRTFRAILPRTEIELATAF
jgi:hypothetical protein